MTSGHGTRGEDIIKAADKIGIHVYSPEEMEELPGMKVNPDFIYNNKILAVIARVGWGTLWKTLQAGKPIITPSSVWAVNSSSEGYVSHFTTRE